MIWLIGVAVGVVLTVARHVSRRRHVDAILKGVAADYDPALPSRLRDPETGEYL